MKSFSGVQWLVLALFIGRAHGQGFINFDTLVPAAGVDAGVYFATSGSAGPGPTFSAALYHVPGPGLFNMIPGSLTTFRDGSFDSAAARYVVPITVAVPGTTPGQPYSVWFVAWPTWRGTYEQAAGGSMPMFSVVQSGPLAIPSLGTSDQPALLPPFDGMFIGLPEPSTVTIVVIGLLFLGWFRCRSMMRP